MLFGLCRSLWRMVRKRPHPPKQCDAAGKGAAVISTILRATAMAAAVAVLALFTPRIIGSSESSSVPPSLVIHTVMLGLSVVLSLWLTKGQIAKFGFTTGTFRLKPAYFLWVLPMSILTTLQFVGSRSGALPNQMGPQSVIDVVLLVWIYASVCEEVFVRGPYQSCLAPIAHYRVAVFRKWSLSAPIMLSGLFFGAMHVVVWPRMGPKTLAIIGLALTLGIIAGYYREKTGSLVPAILIHALFNIGGTLPYWVMRALFTKDTP